MSEQQNYLSPNNPINQQAQLPNATATLVLGILSIVVCFVCGIIALAISSKDLALYRANPEMYSESSYNSLKAGRICAIIGLALQLLGLLVYIIFFVIMIGAASSGGFR